MNPEKSLEQAVSTSLSISESDGREKMGEGSSETEDQLSPLSTEENIDNATQREISRSEVQETRESSIIRRVYNLSKTLWVKLNQPIIINFNLPTFTPIKSPIEPEIKVEVEQIEMESNLSPVESPLDEQSESNLPQLKSSVDEQSESNLSPVESPLDEQPESNLSQLKSSVDEQQHLIEQALAKDKAELEQDKQELKIHAQKIQQWTQRWKTLKQTLKANEERIEQILSDSRKIQGSLPHHLQEQFQGRQQGLDLIGKMLNRLLESTEIDTDDNSELLELPSLSQPDLMTLIEAEQLEQSAEKLIKNKSKEVGIQRWQLVTQQRDLAEQYRKNWLHFVERKVLPILDGINEGKQHAETLISQLPKDNAEQEDNFKHWLQTYSDLQELFSQLLRDIKVYPMQVNIGKSMDYLRYEPFDVQPDLKLNNECVKEEIRQGYEYEIETEKEPLVLRPALVVVVKNDQG
jgi:molecular chaperone GrpE (heat shock protein)